MIFVNLVPSNEPICEANGSVLLKIPQVFTPYKEVPELYDEGNLELPGDVAS